jgi:hypothetical protein
MELFTQEDVEILLNAFRQSAYGIIPVTSLFLAAPGC